MKGRTAGNREATGQAAELPEFNYREAVAKMVAAVQKECLNVEVRITPSKCEVSYFLPNIKTSEPVRNFISVNDTFWSKLPEELIVEAAKQYPPDSWFWNAVLFDDKHKRGKLFLDDESIDPQYHPPTVDTAEAITAARAILSRVYPAERVGKALEDLATGGESAGTDDLAQGKPRPAPAAEGPEWPSEKWNHSPEKAFRKQRAIITFLERVWEPFIQKTGTVMTRDILARHDADAEWALTRFLERHDMPKEISIIYPQQLMKIVSERPELVRAVLRAASMAGQR